MDNRLQENNPHVGVEEQARYCETNGAGAEFQPRERETFFSEEIRKEEEIPTQGGNSRQKTDEGGVAKRAAALSAFLPTAAVVITVGGAVALSLTSLPPLEKESEYISFNAYECAFLQTEEELFLTALIESADGEERTVEIVYGDGLYNLYCGSLAPETEYRLSVVDQDGKERFSDEFKTGSFIFLQEGAENTLNFALHADVSFQSDVSVRLFSSGGGEFYSNLIMEEPFDITANTLLLDGLYFDEYTLQMEIYNPYPDGVEQEENRSEIYEKKISLGNLQKLNFSTEYAGLMADSPTVYLTYLSGDLSPYSPTEIILINKQTEQYYFIDGVETSPENDVAVYLDAQNLPEAGDYKIILCGEFEKDGQFYTNEIWVGEITLPQI